jgi:glycosyltransferase involved in cell wall biosynthesis
MRASVSVVLCCHNSAQRLPSTLQHLAAVKVPPGVDWEVLLVDNASTDDTAACARRLWAQAGAPAPLRLLPEPRQGLNYARWAGIRAVRGDIVSFVDDDNWVDARWLEVVTDVFGAEPRVGAVGAWAEPVCDGPIPAWFERVQHLYACGPQGPAARPVPAARGYQYGARLAVRRMALLELDAHGFAPRLVGRSGASLAGGEDSELCRALTGAGWTLWYEPRLRLRHFMPAGRLTLQYARRLSFEMGRAAVRLETVRPVSGRRRASVLLHLRPFAVLWYALRWAARATPLPGREPHPLGGSYDLGRLTQALGYPRQG